MRILLILLLIVTAGCASTQDAKGLLKTLEFDDDECGCFRGTATISPSFFSGTIVTANLYKRKVCPGEETAPAC